MHLSVSPDDFQQVNFCNEIYVALSGSDNSYHKAKRSDLAITMHSAGDSFNRTNTAQVFVLFQVWKIMQIWLLLCSICNSQHPIPIISGDYLSYLCTINKFKASQFIFRLSIWASLNLIHNSLPKVFLKSW